MRLAIVEHTPRSVDQSCRDYDSNDPSCARLLFNVCLEFVSPTIRILYIYMSFHRNIFSSLLFLFFLFNIVLASRCEFFFWGKESIKDERFGYIWNGENFYFNFFKFNKVSYNSLFIIFSFSSRSPNILKICEYIFSFH